MAAGGYQPMESVNRGPIVDWQKEGADKKLAAGLCGILLGGFGVHKFILGYTTEGILEIVITICTCGVGHFIGLIEGIIYLTKSDEEFVRTYIQGRKAWF
jgi:TM2 domain-containing membrane protein YozV